MNLFNSKTRKRLKYLAHIEMGQSPPSTEYSLSPDDGLPFLQGTADFGHSHPIPHIYCGSPTKVAFKEDILFSVRAPVGDLNIANEEIGIGRGLCAIRSGHSWLNRYVWWALHESRVQLNYVSTGSTYEAVSTEDVANLYIVINDIKNQKVIADFLDHETARIDTLIEAKENLLELLAEKRKALITRAVTRGVDQNVPMRDSGVPWLGEVPAHWGMKRSKWLFTERDERSITGEETLLSLRMENGLIPHNEVSEKHTVPYELIGYKRISPDEIVINRMRASIGLIAISSKEGLVSPDYAVFTISKDVNPFYFENLFKTSLLQSVFRSESTGLGTGSSGFLRLYSEKFLSLWFPCPPYEEQNDIHNHIIIETSKIDSLKVSTENSIKLLKERRSALISEAVTGRLDISSFV